MNKEKSCGAVIFRIINNEIYYLIEKMSLGHISLCKGHIENNETEEETALREIKEETSLDVILDTSFKETISYKPYKDKDIIKDVVFFIAYSNDLKTPKDNHDNEVNYLNFYKYEEAISLLTYESDKNILEKANNYINKNISKYLVNK